MSWAGYGRRLLLGIGHRETTFARRGFSDTDPAIRERLETIGQTFAIGYHAALIDPRPDHVVRRLAEVPAERVGFAYEGAAMGAAIVDSMTPWNRRHFSRLLNGPAANHVYMAYVGLGWAAARLPWQRRRLDALLLRHDPLLRWLILDGYGFHEAYFKPQETVTQMKTPPGVNGYAQRAFDQGVGRCLWFVCGTKISRIAGTIIRFPRERRGDLWSGIGLACAYAGGVDRRHIELLLDLGSAFQPQLAQGAAFAAQARRRAGNPAPHTDIACQILCGRSADEAAAVTTQCLLDLPTDTAPLPSECQQPAFELWRQRIAQQLTGLKTSFAHVA